MRFLACPRKANLSAAAGYDARPWSGAAGTGSFFHALMDVALCGPKGVMPEDIKFVAGVGKTKEESTLVDCSMQVERFEAERCFRDWLIQYSRTWAETFVPLGCEVELPIDEAQSDTLFGLTSGLRRTLALDALLWVPQSKELWTDLGTIRLAEGLYVMDHKTHGARAGTLLDEYGLSNQLAWYGAACRALYPDLQWRGILVNQVITTKTPKFGLFFRPMPNEVETKRAIGLMTMAEEWRQNPVLSTWANTNECVHRWGLCHYHVSAGGVCEGI